MAKLNRNGVNIYYEVHGSGPALILSHGYSATAQMWKGQIEPLSKKHTLILWDMRGHGQSDYPADQAAYSEEHTVADIAALLDQVGAKKAIVGGLSLGGYMTLAFYNKHPDRCRSLLIIDTGPGFKKDEARAKWNETAHRRAADLEARGLAALNTSDEVKLTRHRDATGLAHAARGMLAQEGSAVIDGLGAIRVPTLVIVGDQDQPFVAPSEYMAKKIAGARLEVIRGAGHSSNLDQPEAFNRVLREFLQGL